LAFAVLLAAGRIASFRFKPNWLFVEEFPEIRTQKNPPWSSIALLVLSAVATVAYVIELFTSHVSERLVESIFLFTSWVSGLEKVLMRRLMLEGYCRLVGGYHQTTSKSHVSYSVLCHDGNSSVFFHNKLASGSVTKNLSHHLWLGSSDFNFSHSKHAISVFAEWRTGR
jgi:hypothetical protein